MKYLILAVVLVLSTSLAFAAKVGAPAPGFTGTSSATQDISLGQYRGQYVVLQWHNKDCPYVQAHYDSGHMQKLQKEWTAKGVIWLTIISSAVGKQGYVDGKGAEADVRNTIAVPTATILDPTGAIGRAYRAQTTPHMFVIDPQGTLIYSGSQSHVLRLLLRGFVPPDPWALTVVHPSGNRYRTLVANPRADV